MTVQLSCGFGFDSFSLYYFPFFSPLFPFSCFVFPILRIWPALTKSETTHPRKVKYKIQKASTNTRRKVEAERRGIRWYQPPTHVTTVIVFVIGQCTYRDGAHITICFLLLALYNLCFPCCLRHRYIYGYFVNWALLSPQKLAKVQPDITKHSTT